MQICHLNYILPELFQCLQYLPLCISELDWDVNWSLPLSTKEFGWIVSWALDAADSPLGAFDGSIRLFISIWISKNILSMSCLVIYIPLYCIYNLLTFRHSDRCSQDRKIRCIRHDGTFCNSWRRCCRRNGSCCSCCYWY